MPPCYAVSHLERCGAIEFGGVDCLWKDISDIGDEFFQILTGFLQVCCVDNNLDKLENKQILTSFDKSHHDERLSMNQLYEGNERLMENTTYTFHKLG